MAGIFGLLLSGAVTVVDQFFEYTTLLLPGNGTNGAQNNTFLDGSTNNFTITRNGNTTQGTFSPFSQTGWGNYFGGSAALTAGSASDWAFMSNTTALWSVEMWVYPTTSGSQTVFLDTNAGASASIGVNIYKTTSNAVGIIITRGVSGSVVINSSSTGTLTTNAWNYVLITYDQSLASGNLNIYINGGSAETFNKTANTPSSSNPTYTLNIGRAASAIEYFTGYLSNIRISNVIRSSTVPTSPLASDGNTKLLTCQSNRFRDASSNTYAITLVGSPSVQAFSPFNPSASWSAATYGGSGYFDGSGDYLTAPLNSAIDLGTGNFTVEAFVYWLGSGTTSSIFEGKQNGFGLGFNAGKMAIAQSFVSFLMTDPSAFPTRQWIHVAASRSGTNLSLFVNGARVATSASNSTNFVTNSTNLIGFSGAASPVTADYFDGYINGFRIVKGTAVYDPTLTTLTVPTAPLTAITNTSLLLNFTNAGIYDATSKNDLETVGNAQISTTQSKWGGSSMAFDGTGDYLNFPALNLYALGSGDFTYEYWVYLNTLSGTPTFVDTRTTGASASGISDYKNVSNKVVIYFNSTDILTSTTSLTATQWTHIAVSRASGTLRIFINGVLDASTSNSTNFTDQTLLVGVNRNVTAGSIGSGFLNGYIQDLRITKGYARYTANFTPPTAAFPTL